MRPLTLVSSPFSIESGSNAPVDTGGEPPDDGGMEARIVKLEEFVGEARTELRAIDVRLTKIETRLDSTATKADVADLGSTMVKWIVGTVSGLGIAGITVMTFVLNNATPRSAPAGQSQPIVIYAQPAPVAAPGSPPHKP